MVVMRGKCPGENTSYSMEFQKDTVFSRTLEVLLTKGQWWERSCWWLISAAGEMGRVQCV